MKKLAIKWGVFCCILLIIDFAWGIIFSKITDKVQDGRYYKAKYALEKTSEEILIFGSSLGETNYISKIFEDSLGMTCYNVSRGNQLLPFFNCIKEATLRRYTPRYVILDIHPSLVAAEPDYAIAGEILKPFYRSHQEIQPILNKQSKTAFIVNLSNLYCYNSSYFYLLRPLLKKGLDGKEEDKGWKPRYGITDKTSDILMQSQVEINMNAIKAFFSFTDSLMKAGTQLIFCASPFYNRMGETPSTLIIKEYAKQHNIPYFDYSNTIELVTNHAYFRDPNHLNDKGAMAFTNLIVKDIKHYIKTKQ